MGYNALEAVASIALGWLAASIALVGFGLDSIVESLSGLVLIWRLRQHGRVSEATEEDAERRAVRFVAVTFFVLGTYVLVESVRKLALREAPDPSLAGIVLAGVSVVAMPFLAWQKRRTAAQIGSRALLADARETLACALLSVALLVGLGANYWFGLWQADPVAGMVITGFLFREGWEGWRVSGEGP